MAAAEARAVWQRTANRCFVQEDAKRAPKLACCQTSSALKQVDAGPTAPPEGTDHPSAGFSPLNRTSSKSNLLPDTRWWLHMQQNHGYRKGFTFEQINSLENDEGPSVVVNSGARTFETHKRKGDVSDLERGGDYFAGENHGAKKKAGDAKGFSGGRKSFEELMMQKDHVETSYDEKLSEMFIDTEKSEPWWRMADKDELVSLVVRKSLDHVENCDLPPPQKMCHRRTQHSRVGILALYPDWNTQAGILSGGTSKSVDTSSCTNMAEIQDCEGEFSKAQLMEALCHSQTRAREAEKAAKQACAEKDHIITLFFRQASVLFAYKQWLKFLQLESFSCEFKSKDKRISSLFPLALPWKSLKRTNGSSKRVESNIKGDQREVPSHDMTRYAVAFALGLSLVGAGLLLGWTVGWMFPRLEAVSLSC